MLHLGWCFCIATCGKLSTVYLILEPAANSGLNLQEDVWYIYVGFLLKC